MINIRDIHRSLPFNILIIFSAFLGIVFCIHLAGTKKEYFTREYFYNSSDKPKKIHSKIDHENRIVVINFGSLEYRKYPIDSVPVKVVLGKIKKIDNPYLPELHLALMEDHKKILGIKDKYAIKSNY